MKTHTSAGSIPATIERKRAGQNGEKRKMQSLTIRIPRRDLSVLEAVAEHFGITPESIMQCQALGELNCVHDAPFRVLSMHDEFLREAVDMVPVELLFIPSAYCLLETAAGILRRPLNEFVAGMLVSSTDTVSCEVREALKRGGIDENPVLMEWAEEWLKFEFETRRGQLPLDHSGWDRWTALEMEHVMPAAYATKQRKGVRP